MSEDTNPHKLTLFHAVPSRSAIVAWMLEELDVPYDVELIDVGRAEHMEPAYLRINPMGKVPALRHGDVIVTEVAAICCYLADVFLESGLAPAVDDERRGPYLSWLFFAPSCIEPALIANALGWSGGKRGMLGWGDFDSVVARLRQGVSDASPYLLGETFTAADIVVGSQVRFGRLFGTLPDEAVFADYVGLLEERPALQRQIAKDKVLAES